MSLLNNRYVAAATCALILSPAQAGVIDFEEVPGDIAADQLPISNQYLATHGVTFSLSDGGTPYLEKRGSQDVGQAFKNNVLGGQPDVERDGYTGRFGNFFLRLGTDSLFVGPAPDIVIDYVAPVAAASGEIWDIDGPSFAGESEKWRITALDTNDNVLETIDSPEIFDDDENSLDGLPWAWAFDRPAADISQIRMTFTGTKTDSIGIAFDNFFPDSAAAAWPEVAIDVLPGDEDNIIYPFQGGRLPVAVLGGAEFDATQIRPQTLRFGPGEAGRIRGSAEIEDVDGQFGLDYRFKFEMAEALIQCDAIQVLMTGETYAGDPFRGYGAVDASDCSAGSCHPY